MKTLDDYKAQYVIAKWCQFDSLELLSHSTPSFPFDENDFLESWWNLGILFKKQSAFTVEKSESSGEKSFKINLP